MKTNKNIEILKDIGLSEEEALVYLASLSLGKTTVLRISNATGLKRTKVYGVIESLKKKGLMSIDLQGLKNAYVAESPEKLEITLERKIGELKSQLPELMALHDLKGGESVIKYYIGLDSMKQVFSDGLREIKPGQDYLVIANQEKWYNLDPKFAMSFIEDRARLNIKIKLLFQDSELAREHKKFERNFNEKVKILPEGTKLNVDTILLPHKMVVVDLNVPYMTVVIENRSIIELQRQMFELLWKSIV